MPCEPGHTATPMHRVNRTLSLLLLLLYGSAAAQAIDGNERIKAARMRWEYSTHGEMLRRILPPTTEAAQLPEPASPRSMNSTTGTPAKSTSPPVHGSARWRRACATPWRC